MKNFKTAFKFIKRNKFFASINILGLSIALAVSFIMLLYIINEFSFDRSHTNREKVFRVVNYYKELDNKMSGTPYPLAEDLKADFPQIENATNTRSIRGFSIQVNNEWVRQRTMATTSEIFDVFTIPLMVQNKQTDALLQSPDDIVISEKTAKLVFGAENPVNKQVTVSFNGEEKQFNVVAVSQNLPENSTLQASCFINNKWSLADINKAFQINNAHTNYELDFWTTWIKLDDKSISETLVKEFDNFLKAHSKSFKQKEYMLQNLTEYHLHSNDILNSENIGNLSSLKIIGAIAFLILIVASFNYITLSTAISTNRAKEIGIRKTNGASIASIRKQLLTESVLIALVALPIAFLLMYFMMPYAEQLFELRLTFIKANILKYALFFIALTVIIGLLSGLYSSSYLSKLKTIDIINRKPFVGRKKSGFRTVLTVFQLVVFCVFVASAFIVRSQYKYAMQKDLGYRTSNLLFVDIDDENIDYKLFMERVKSFSAVSSVGCATDALPMFSMSKFMINHFTQKDKKIEVEGLDVDYNYLETMGIRLKEGRYFSEKFGTDLDNAIILNEEAVKQLGITDPIGKKINDRTIIGVTDDFILHSIHSKTAPLAIELTDRYISQMAIHYKEGQLATLLPILKKEWAKIYTDKPFNYADSADINREIYAGEQTFFKIVTLACLFTLIIAMLGLLGLTMFVTKSRTKEIGIRKVVGSSRIAVVALLLRGNIYKVIIAVVISSPLSYLLMSEWLKNYAFSTKINLLYFVLTGVIALITVFFTVIVQSYLAASRNPVEALRYE